MQPKDGSTLKYLYPVIEFQIMILARPEGGTGVSRTHSTSSTISTDNAVQNLYLEVYSGINLELNGGRWLGEKNGSETCGYCPF